MRVWIVVLEKEITSWEQELRCWLGNQGQVWLRTMPAAGEDSPLGPECFEWQWALRDLLDLFSNMSSRCWWALVTLKDPIHLLPPSPPRATTLGRKEHKVSTLGSDTKCLCKPFTFPPFLLPAKQRIWTRQSYSRWILTFQILVSSEISNACYRHISQRNAQTPQVLCTLLRDPSTRNSFLPKLSLNLLLIHKPQVNNYWTRQILTRHF